MTYSARELSADQARPIELYEFRRESMIWRYTSTDTPITLDAQVYTPATIQRSAIEQGSELNRAGLSLTVQRDLGVVELFQAGPPSDAVTMTLRQLHVDDTEARLIWSGRILSVTTWEGGRARISLEPVYTSVRRNGLRRLYQRSCPHILYGAACRVSSASFRVTGNVDAISGLVVALSEVAAFPAGYFAGGFVEWLIELGIYERRFIESHAGADLVLTVAPRGLAVSTEVRVYPGCDHLLATCSSKFANAANFGGLPFMPTKNPFGGSPLF